MRYALAAAYLGSILAANYVTSAFGMVSVFGVAMTAGTFFAGATFVLRDSLQDAAGKHAVYVVIALGAVLSFAVSVPAIAIASGLAFLASETADLVVYTPLRGRGYVRAAVASNVVGSLVDTLLFLWVAGFPVWPSMPGQMVGKLAITLAVVALVGGVRVVRSEPVRA